MRKILAIIPIAIIYILLSSKLEVFAVTLNDIISEYSNVVVSSYNSNNTQYTAIGSNNGLSYNGTHIIPQSNTDMFYAVFSSDPTLNYDLDTYIYTTTYGQLPAYNPITIKGHIENLPDPIIPEPTWYDKMWDELGEILGNPDFWFGEWFTDIIYNVFGDGANENTISDSVDIENPTITPTPTQIPYTTIIIPKTDTISGDTYYETNYYFNNPSGTPIVQPYPPTNQPSTNSPSSGYDYTPIGGDPYSIPVVSWLNSTTIGDSNYDGIDSVGSGLDSIDSVGSEYTDGMGIVQDATGTLPTSWLLLIGIAAAIPLIAGIISRFLS